MIGERFGSLVVLLTADGGTDGTLESLSHHDRVICRCDCGRLCAPTRESLTTPYLARRVGACAVCREPITSAWYARFRKERERDAADKVLLKRFREQANEIANATRRKTKHLIRKGVIRQAAGCEICGTEHDLESHHENYRDPLHVIFLCGYHHQRRHLKLAYRGRDPRTVLVRELAAAKAAG